MMNREGSAAMYTEQRTTGPRPYSVNNGMQLQETAEKDPGAEFGLRQKSIMGTAHQHELRLSQS